MANDFKRFAKGSVTDSQTGASADAVYTVPAGGGSTALESIIVGISMCNKTSSSITGGIFLDNFDGTNDAYLVKEITIPAFSQVEVMTGNKLVLQNNGTTGDVIRAEASAATSLDVIVSVLEDV
jgi:hypothetical protein